MTVEGMDAAFRQLEERLARAGEGALVAWRTAVDQALIDAHDHESEWRRFLLASAHRIARGGARALVQEALCEPQASPVARAAERWCADQPLDWRPIVRLDRDRRRELSPCLRIIEAHDGPAQSTAIHPSLPLLLSGGADGCVRLWDLDTGALEREWRTDGMLVCGIAPAPDGRRVVVGASPYVEVWDIDTDRRLLQVASGLIHFAFLALHSDGKRVVLANAERALTRNLESGSQIYRQTPLPPGLRGVAILPDGEHAAAMRGFRVLDTWSLDDGAPGDRPTEPGHSRARIEMERAAAAAHAVVIHGQRAYTISGEKRIVVWDMPRHEQLHALSGHDGPVRALALDSAGRRLASAADDGTVRLWDTTLAPAAPDPSAHQGAVVFGGITAGGERGLSVCEGGLLKQWDLDATLCLSTQQPFWRVAPDHHLTCAAASAEAVFMGDNRGALKRIEHSGKSGWRIAHTAESMLALAVDASGARLAALSRRTLRILDARAGSSLAAAEPPDQHFEPALAFTSTDRVAAAAGSSVVLFDAESGSPLTTLAADGTTVTALCPATDDMLLAGAEDGEVRLFDLASSRLSRSFRAHERAVTSIARAADGLLLCTTGADRCFKIWTPAGRCLGRFELDTRPTACGFGPDGRLMVGDASGRIILFKLC